MPRWLLAMMGLWAMDARGFELLRSALAAMDGKAFWGEPAAREPVNPLKVVDGVGYVDIKGVLAKEAPSWDPEQATLGEMTAAVARATNDAAIRQIVLRIDSPGGTVAGTGELADAVAAARKVKPVSAWVQDLAASGAWWVASQAGKIVVNHQTAMVGSIGVYGVVWDVSRQAEKYGIKVHVIRSTAGKGAGEPGTEVTPEQLAEWQRTVDQQHAMFVAAVASGRGVSEQVAAGWATGQVWVAGEALRMGLIDGIGGIGDALGMVPGGAAPGNGTPVRGGGRKAEAGGRGTERSEAMNPKVRAFLVSMGMNPQATEEQAQAFLAGLSEEKRAEASASATAAPAPGTGTPAPAPAPAAGQAVGMTVEQAIVAERERARTLRVIGLEVRMDSAAIQEHIDRGTSVAAFQEAALAHAAQALRPVQIGGGNAAGGVVTGGVDRGRETIAGAIEQALCMQLHVGLPEPTNDIERATRARAQSIRGHSFSDLGREFLAAHGVNMAGMSRGEIAQECFRRRSSRGFTIHAAAGAYSTSDFPAILGSTTRRILLAAYETTEVTWNVWTGRVPVSDFRDTDMIRVGEIGRPPKVGERGEYKRAQIGEGRESIRVAKYGQILELSWESMVNDDLGALTQLPQDAGRAMRELEDWMAYQPLINNDKLLDGKALFHNDHNNIATTATTLTEAQFESGWNKVASQKGINTNVRVRLRPKFILIPATEQFATDRLLNNVVRVGATNGEKNVLQGLVQIVPTEQLIDYAGRILMVGPTAPTVNMAFLRGFEQPYVTEQESNNPDVVQIFMRHVVGSGVNDYRTAAKLPSA